uniref:NADH dehydrogenase subunit 4L n=1 Tax=Acropyga pallida TaxID=602221 RepID=A0A6G5NIG4_9HYME|nr:NADH dehydrogenase subunit 4L [Acropyga pallida]QBG38659.1 NADH dehydrogenase subunit 4L [Acropyga pallida]
MYIDMLMYSYIYLIILIMLSLMYKYMLLILIIIEFMVLTIFMIMYLIFSLINLEMFVIYYLVFSVCEGVLGLALLILTVRFHGNELYYLFNINKF